ncbi:MAG: flagellar export chaperone FliS [Acidobacteria bacterium]|nr:flagellar export chaperone FliS [Acidobacteriota bacterium]
MVQQASDAYLEAQVMSASPLELVRILYGAAEEAVRKARGHLAAGDIRARSQEITRAVAMLAELAGVLDRSRGGEVAERLAVMYDYMTRQLLEANVLQQDGPLVEVVGLLATLRQAWDQLHLVERPEPCAVPAAYGAEAWAGAHSWSA